MKKRVIKYIQLAVLGMGIWGMMPETVEAASVYDVLDCADGLIDLPEDFMGMEVTRVHKADSIPESVKYNELVKELNTAAQREYDDIRGVDPDLWVWFLKCPNYDFTTKWEIVMSSNCTSNEVFYWVIQNEGITHEQKVDYVRTHEIQHTDDNVKTWWWTYIGSQLKLGETTEKDHLNMGAYRRALYEDGDGYLESVRVGERYYYIDVDNLQRCLESGTICEKLHEISFDGGMHWGYVPFYYSNVGLDVGYMMW